MKICSSLNIRCRVIHLPDGLDKYLGKFFMTRGVIKNINDGLSGTVKNKRFWSAVKKG
jgi:hypothetical protein